MAICRTRAGMPTASITGTPTSDESAIIHFGATSVGDLGGRRGCFRRKDRETAIGHHPAARHRPEKCEDVLCGHPRFSFGEDAGTWRGYIGAWKLPADVVSGGKSSPGRLRRRCEER